MTSKDQEMTYGLSMDRKELLTITHKRIESDSQTCLKTILQKNKGKTFNENESYVVIKPKIQNVVKETQTISRKLSRGVTPDKEEDDCLLKIFWTDT